MQVDHAVNVAVKRPQDINEGGLSTSLPKRLKFKTESDEEVNGSVPTKPPTQGVESIPYPAECRPTSIPYAWYRQQLVKENTERLALQNKRVTTTRFLDDGVAFDWVLDRLACSSANERIPARPLDSRHEATTNFMDKSSGWKSEGQNIPGLHFHNSGTTVNISEGTLANPIVIHEDCNADIKLEEKISVSQERTQERTPNVNTVDFEMSMSETDVFRGNANSLSSKASKSSPGGPSNDEGSLVVSHKEGLPVKLDRKAMSRQVDPTPAVFQPRVIIGEDLISHSHGKELRRPKAHAVTRREGDMAALGSSRPINENQTDSIDGSNGDKSTEASRCASQKVSSRSVTSSSFSSSSSSSSSSSENEDSHILPAAMPSTDQNISQCACSAHENLKSLNWKNSKSILFIKNLAQASSADDIYLYLQLNGFLSSEICDLRLYPCTTGGPFASVEFLNPQEAAKAKRTIENLNITFPPLYNPKSKDGVEINILVEQCRPPPWWNPGMASEHVECDPAIASLDANHKKITKGFAPRVNHLQSNTYRPSRTEVAEELADHMHGVIEVTSGSDEDGVNEGSSSSFASDFDSDSDSSTTTEGRNFSGSRSTCANYAQAHRIAPTNKICEVQLPRVKHGRARRLLLPLSIANPLMTVTMRGDIQFVEQTTKERLSRLSLPAEVSNVRKLEDACLVNETAVLGFSKDDASQASIVGFVDELNTVPKIFPLRRKPHLHKGILSLTPIRKREHEPGRSLEFLSGGYDKTVQYWYVTPRRRDEGHLSFSSRTHSISQGFLNTQVTSLIHHQGTSRVLAAAGQKLWILDIESHLKPAYSPFSNNVHQLHVQRKDDPSVFIVEVDHLLKQMQVFDVRTACPGSGNPVMEFGYPDSTSPHTPTVRSRKRRGDTSVQYFCRGSHDGTICRWDYRKISEPMIVDKGPNPVTHTVFSGRNIWAFAGDKVKHIEV